MVVCEMRDLCWVRDEIGLGVGLREQKSKRW